MNASLLIPEDDVVIAMRFGNDAINYTEDDVYNGTLKRYFRTGSAGNYQYYEYSDGYKIKGVYYSITALEFFYKVKYLQQRF